ncbi:MAG: aminoacetone oxidase family FAD-binding enzyme [Clostridia bacterium]|nr:aminoacetone oxidase family FAD-binding enzyme [Clostridia bacterium]
MSNKIAIIGGGAAGLVAAISAKYADNNCDVTVFDRLDRVGKKILATGNGCCNLTNINAGLTVDDTNGQAFPVHYFGKNADFALPALKSFSVENTISFFENLGVLTRLDEDKYYPYSLQAGTVLDALRFECERLCVKFRLGVSVDKIGAQNGKFSISGDKFDCCIVAAGGKSSPHLGSDGSGYKLLEAFGHKCSPLLPAITQIKTETDFVKQLKGIKIDADVTISVDNKNVRTEFGQVLFADYGLSGPPVFQLSGIAAYNYNKNCLIKLNLMPEYDFNSLLQLVTAASKRNSTCENMLSGILNKRLGQVVIKAAGYPLSTATSQLKPTDLKNIVNTIKQFSFKVTGVQGFANAQVTAGGIYTNDFDSATMQSKLIRNLYAAGEVLDIYGDCGGYNLQWAFSSGYIAGKSAATRTV